MPKVETFSRATVIEKATDVFLDKGYNATSMQDLVDATGLNRSSIYNSFVNKIELYMVCLKDYQTKFSRETSKQLLKANHSLNAIKSIFELYVFTMTRGNQDKGCLIVNCKAEMANHDKSITTFLEKNQENMLQLLEDLVINGQKEGLINSKQTSKNYALYLYSSIQGLRMTGILITDKAQLQSIVNSILQTIN